MHTYLLFFYLAEWFSRNSPFNLLIKLEENIVSTIAI